MLGIQNKQLLMFAIRGISSVILIALLLFIPAGTLNYHDAWVFLGTLTGFSFVFSVWLYYFHRDQFYNRLKSKEPRRIQRILLMLIGFDLSVALVVSGLDNRFGWSNLSRWRYAVAGLLLCVSTILYINVFRVNPFLSNIVEIHECQHIVDSGAYGLVRHPMYLATCLTCASGMIILGSVWNIPLFLIIVHLVYVRIYHEEKQLVCSIPEYTDYITKVPYKLIPVSIFRLFTK